MDSIFKYKTSGKEISLNDKCLICKSKITDDEFAFEDYFVVFRGHSEKCFEGVICFKCLKERCEYELD